MVGSAPCRAARRLTVGPDTPVHSSNSRLLVNPRVEPRSVSLAEDLDRELQRRLSTAAH